MLVPRNRREVAQAQAWIGQAVGGGQRQEPAIPQEDDAIFLTKRVSGPLKIGDKRELDKAAWRKPQGLRLTPTSRYICDKLFPVG